MKNRKGLALLLSLTLLVCVALPGTLALAADQDADSSTLTIIEDTQTPAPSASESPAETPAPAESAAPAEPTPSESAAPAEPTPSESATPAEPTPSQSAKPADTVSPDATGLYAQIMACTTVDDIWNLIDAASESALNALTDAQWTQIDARIDALEPEPAPAIVVEESEPPVESEVGYETVTYTYVAPLVDPITGQHR